jgi:fructose-1-phosphate kinase PfkB-like protein
MKDNTTIKAKSKPRFLVVCLNPTIQKTLVFGGLKLDAVNRALQVRTDASGKGVNVARVLVQCGYPATHLTHAGGPNKDWFLSLCKTDGLDVAWVDSGSEVRFCTTVIDKAAGTATELVEEARAVAHGTEDRLLEEFENLLPDYDVFIFSGTKAAGYSDSLVPRMVQRATSLKKLVVLDIKGKDLVASLPFGPAVVKPNLEELLASLPKDAQDTIAAARTHEAQEAITRAAVADLTRSWKDQYGTELVVTRGSRSVWFNENGVAAEIPVTPVKALNPIGSGDSFTAGLAVKLAEGKSLREAIQEGNRLGGLNALQLKPGSILSEPNVTDSSL